MCGFRAMRFSVGGTGLSLVSAGGIWERWGSSPRSTLCWVRQSSLLVVAQTTATGGSGGEGVVFTGRVSVGVMRGLGITR